MAVLPLRFFPDEVLRQKARKVTSINGRVRRLVEDMIETMRAVGGVGLAAPQVGVSLRVTVIEIPGNEVLVLINPTLLKKKGERVVEEGCLSLPGYKGELKRSTVVKVRGKDIAGREQEIKAEGLLAQVLEHEIDHLNGILYIDRLEGREKLYRIEKESEA